MVAVAALLVVPSVASAATDVVVRMAGGPGEGAGIGVGEQLPFSIDVRNEGADPAENVTLSDALPAGVEPVSVQNSQGSCSLGGTVECSLGRLEPFGGYATVYIGTRTKVEGDWSNTVFVDSDTEDANRANNQATVSFRIMGPVPRVTEAQMVRPAFRAGTRNAIAFVVSRPVTMNFEIERRVFGGWRRAGAPFSRHAAEGENLVGFSGRVRRRGRVRALRPGRYRARLVAVGRDGSSVPRFARFRVLR